ncbi:peptidase [Paracoccaceae bacterium GXU_MW_L88]
MTYCVGVLVDAGLVLLSDTRTNAGLDNISTYRKLFIFEEPGDRVICLQTAGSLSVTQTVLARINEAIKAEDGRPSLMTCETMLEVAEMVGGMLREVSTDIQSRLGQKGGGSASILLSGQLKGGQMRLFLLYDAGNFIEATDDTPFLQIGEHKYGKPILDRVIDRSVSLAEARKAALLSMDSTIRSNLSVGMPLDLVTIPRDEWRVESRERFEAGDEKIAGMSEAWSRALRDAYTQIEI